MANLNRVELEGHIGKDPELRYTPNQKAVCTFSLAVSEGKDDAKKTEWIRCVLWGFMAESFAAEVKQGDAVRFSGKLSTRKYTDKKDNIERYTTEVVGFSYWHRKKREKQSNQPDFYPDPEPSNILDEIPF